MSKKVCHPVERKREIKMNRLEGESSLWIDILFDWIMCVRVFVYFYMYHIITHYNSTKCCVFSFYIKSVISIKLPGPIGIELSLGSFQLSWSRGAGFPLVQYWTGIGLHVFIL